MTLNKFSRHITQPKSQGASQAMLYATGMNDAESTPSPKRFCKKLGMRSAALNASAASEFPFTCSTKEIFSI